MAELLIDELKKIFPKQSGKFKVMIAGTFDIIHTGHLYLISEAAKIGDLTVVIARDISVMQYKGQLPIIPESQRMEIVKSIKGVKNVKLGSENGKLISIVNENPELFLLGPNQWGVPTKFEREIRKFNVPTIFRRLPMMDTRFELNSSTKIKTKILEKYKVNIVSNSN